MDTQNIKASFLFVRSLLLFFLAFLVKVVYHKPVTDVRLFLIGSNYGDDRDENATALYEYIHSLDYSVFYLSNATTSIDTVKRSAFKSYISFFRSDAVFFTHSFSDILPYLHKAHWILKYFNLPQRIFIQHGVIGLKSQISADISMADYLVSISHTFDKMVVSSQLEFEIVKGLGIPEGKLAITGLPRFDFLSHGDTGLNVLIFLTWSSMEHYQHKLNEILNSEAIRLLQASGLKIIVEQHTMIQRAVKRMDDDIANATSLQSAIKSSSLLITDDSSVAWDFFYKGSEVIFYKPDPDWLVWDNSSLNARVARSGLVLKQLAQDFVDSAVDNTPQACDFNDHHNAARVFSLTSKPSS